MPIRLHCTCGKQYLVADQHIGRRIKCKQCDALIRVIDEPEVVATQCVEPRNPETRPIRPTPPVSKPSPQPHDHSMEHELEYVQRKTDSAASNPGMLRVNRWRYVRAFPFWGTVWHLPLLAFFILIFVHWIFILPTLLFAAACFLYWRRIKYNFIAGCVNPGVVLSLDPPLIAVLTNLTKGGGQWNVIKVLRHPLHRMSSGMPTVGQRVVTIAGYIAVNEVLEHWDDFEPVIPDVVSTDFGELKRLKASVSDTDWQELDDGLKQLSQPLSEGLYRIYDFTSLPGQVNLPEGLVAHWVQVCLSRCSMTQFASTGIEHSFLQNATAYIPPAVIPSVIAISESASVSMNSKHGFAITPTHFFFNYPNIGSGCFAFSQLAGALMNDQGVEVTLRNGARAILPKPHLTHKARLGLETLLNKLVEEFTLLSGS